MLNQLMFYNLKFYDYAGKYKLSIEDNEQDRNIYEMVFDGSKHTTNIHSNQPTNQNIHSISQSYFIRLLHLRGIDVTSFT